MPDSFFCVRMKGLPYLSSILNTQAVHLPPSLSVAPPRRHQTMSAKRKEERDVYTEEGYVRDHKRGTS
ncbi:uncharacterized [Tachysurus ichikawai]